MERMSRGRECDRKIRVSLLESVETLLKMYGRTHKQIFFDEAKWFAAEAKRVASRILTHDYTQEDATVESIDKGLLAFSKKYE